MLRVPSHSVSPEHQLLGKVCRTAQGAGAIVGTRSLLGSTNTLECLPSTPRW